jgi:hypothetical protein
MLAKSPTLENNLVRFGFRFGRGGAHLARSMMLDDLRRLLEHVPDAQADRDDFARAILDDNCLGKRSAKTRALSLRHLVNLYALDPQVPVFRALRYLWSRDADGQPLLACLVAYVRDAVLRYERAVHPADAARPTGDGAPGSPALPRCAGPRPIQPGNAASPPLRTWPPPGHTPGTFKGR